MRYKLQLSYLGTRYAGWQRQPGDMTLQQVVEEALSTVLREAIVVTGCGRTDAGVHARQYIAHFDAEPVPNLSRTVYQLNAILPQDVAIWSMDETHSSFHARYDALSRTYRYYLHFHKDPFLQEQSYYFHQWQDADKMLLAETASLIGGYSHFLPFCKTGSDAEQYTCLVEESGWQWTDKNAVYTVRANRFLRGMVRLIVGTCLNAALHKITIDEVRRSLDQQTPIPQAWSVPAQGLFLEEIQYPAGE